ncbi:PREDICTED: LOC110751832 [Prunus dulcis]|uniref:PREDICTED: LOC110751832 n=1 Tax=Prunus dulcis TaxID=3755 RepID=A0A5E4F706_PRUDU|nr:uncharacterized protein LOC117619343 [Prunus dulcis]VVA23686.1 PREDICTED: LOC110751832 [Prunus dulcis]
MTISSLLQNPFEMIPSSSSSSSSSSSAVNLVRLHLGEVHFHAMKAAEVEESCNEPQRVHSRPINRPSSADIMSPNASRLYSAAVTNGTNSTTSLSPERVFLSSIPVNGLSRQDAIAASAGYRLNMDLHSSSSHHVVGFCFLPPPELADLNYAARRIPDLNLPPSDVSASELVLRIKDRNILLFIDAVRSLVVKHGSPEELAEYMKNKSSLTKPQLWNLDSIRIWNMLSLSRGGEIEKELVDEGLVEAPIRVEDLPSPLDLVLAPPHHYKASGNQDARIDYKYKQASTWFDNNKETLSSDARNYDVVDEEEVQRSGNYDVVDEEDESSGDEADHHQDQKRKAVAVMDDQDPYDQHLQRKKARHCGALRIDEPANP